MKEDLFSEIIKKFLEGDATAHEKRMLSNWLKEDPRREEIFYHHLSMREIENPQHFPDVSSKTQTYEKFLQGEIPMPTVVFPKYGTIEDTARTMNYRWWLAASIILFISAGFYFFQDEFLYKTYSAEKGMIKAVTLEDGSTVTLNANSSIKVLRDFMQHENREVWIKGEAFFEVTKKRDLMKFIVHTNNFDVEVLGTKFNINNRRCKSEVMLAEGKVKLVAKDKEPLIMKPGEQVSVSYQKGEFEKQIAEPEKYEAWRNNMLVFDNTPLSEVAQIIQDYYGVTIILNDSLLSTRQFTGTLPNNDLNIILLALKTSYGINVEQKGSRIFLSNKNFN